MNFLISILLVIGLTTVALAQQRPTLTTEDVIKWRTAHPDQAEHYIPKAEARVRKEPQSNTQPDAPFLAQEKDWNIRLAQARTLVRELEKNADQAELSAAQARNTFFHKSAESLNANNSTVQQTQEQIERLRRAAVIAQEKLNLLLDEGRQFGYQLSYIAPRLPNGEPNLEYFRVRFLELQTELQDLQSRNAVLQLRTNRVQTTINQTFNGVNYTHHPRRGFLFYPNNGAADAFYLNRLRNELATNQIGYSDSSDRIAFLQAQINELLEEARRAGVPPGTFR